MTRAEIFAEAIRDWSKEVNAEIDKRKHKANDPVIDRYNEYVIMGLQVSHSIMQDCLSQVIKKVTQ